MRVLIFLWLALGLVRDYTSKQTKQDQASKEARQERRQNERLERKDRNVAAEYGSVGKIHWLPQLEYRAVLIRTGEKNKNKRYADISGLVNSVNWDEEGMMLTGSISVVAPVPRTKADRKFTVRDGNIIKLDALWGGKWRNVWVMRVEEPSDDLGRREGTFQLVDDSKIAHMSKGDFKYKKEKKRRPKGWKCDEIAVDVAKKWKIPLGHVAQGTKDITDLVEHNVSPIDAIMQAYKQERNFTGTRFIFSWRHGKLHITKLRRNKVLYALREQIVAAVVSRSRGKRFFTAMELTANVKDGDRKKKKLKATVVAHRAARRYGYIKIQHSLKAKVKSKAEMEDIGRRIIARSIRKHTLPSITISHTGIPWIRRGDAIEINLPEYGFTHKLRPVPPFDGGNYDILFVSKAHHVLDPTGHSMELEFTMADPVAEQKEEERDARDRRRREEKRKERDNDSDSS